MIILFSFIFLAVVLSKIYLVTTHLKGKTFFIKYFQFSIVFASLFDILAYIFFVLDPSILLLDFLIEVSVIVLVEFIVWIFVFLTLNKLWMFESDYFSKTALNALLTLCIIQNLFYFSANFIEEPSFSRVYNPFELLMSIASFIAPLYAIYHKKYLSKFHLSLAHVLLLLTLFNIFIGGNRYQLLGIIFFYVVYLLRVSRKAKIISLITFVLFFITFSGFHYKLKSQAFKNQTVYQKIDGDSFVLTVDINSLIHSTRDRVLHKWYLSGPVLNYINENDRVYFAPIETAFYSFIPSFLLNSSKPWPGSINGNKFSSFEYLVNRIAFNQGYNMSEYPKSLHALWQFGFLGILFLIISSAFFLFLILMVSKLTGDVSRLLPLFAVYPFSYNKFTILPHEILMSLSYLVLPIVFFSIFFHAFKRLFFNSR